MAGLIKTILVLAHGSVPPNLHSSKVNPRINLSSLPAVLPGAGHQLRLERPSSSSSSDKHVRRARGDQEGKEQVPTIATGRELYGGVNSFGFGGANAHVVVEGRAGAFSGTTREGGGSAARAEPVPGEPVPGVAFLFTGQGSQYPGMGRQLYETNAEFRAVVDACDEELAGVLPRRLLSVLYGDHEENAGAVGAVVLQTHGVVSGFPTTISVVLTDKSCSKETFSTNVCVPVRLQLLPVALLDGVSMPRQTCWQPRATPSLRCSRSSAVRQLHYRLVELCLPRSSATPSESSRRPALPVS